MFKEITSPLPIRKEINITNYEAPVVRRQDNAIHWTNSYRYPVDNCLQNKPHFPLDSKLSG